MEDPLILILFLLALTSNLAHGSATAALSPDEKLMVKRRLERINKPAILSFVTPHGDMMDCVEIDKQLAFDHPLLKNHSIQMNPTFKISKPTRLDDNTSSILTASQLLPKNMRCPKGTVLIKRVQEGDLAMEKYTKKMFEINISNSNSSSKFVHPNDGSHREVTELATATENTGVAGIINLWSPAVSPNQYSDVSFYVGNDDGSVANAIVTGWLVNPNLYKPESDATRLYAFWTKDNKGTGCYNLLCPGFVQVSQKITLGQRLSPVSKHSGKQYFVDLTIQQDIKTKNWWLMFGQGQERVGYWPKELFTSLANGASVAGWGGEIMSPANEGAPAMGSGHFAKENYAVACLVKWLRLFTSQGGFPGEKQLRFYNTKPKCYTIMYGKYPAQNEPPPGDWGDFIFVGGPPNCN